MKSMVRGVNGSMNPLQNVRTQFQQLKNNPQQVVELLRKSGRLTEEQMQAISGMNGNIEQIGQYLMQSAPQNMFNQIQQSVMNAQRNI